MYHYRGKIDWVYSTFKELTPPYLPYLILQKYKTTLYLTTNTKSDTVEGQSSRFCDYVTSLTKAESDLRHLRKDFGQPAHYLARRRRRGNGLFV